jgi:hypothetical protein
MNLVNTSIAGIGTQMMNKRTTMYEDDYSYSLHMSGSASTIYHDEDETEADKRVQELRKVVEEVTNKPVASSANRQRMGFF